MKRIWDGSDLRDVICWHRGESEEERVLTPAAALGPECLCKSGAQTLSMSASSWTFAHQHGTYIHLDRASARGRDTKTHSLPKVCSALVVPPSQRGFLGKVDVRQLGVSIYYLSVSPLFTSLPGESAIVPLPIHVQKDRGAEKEGEDDPH